MVIHVLPVSRIILFIFFVVRRFHHVYNCVTAPWMCGYQKYLFWSQFNSNPLSRMVSVGQYQGKHYFFILDIHPLNSGNCRNLSHLAYHATLAPSSTLFLSIIAVLPLHRCRSSPSSSLFLSTIVVVPLHRRLIHITLVAIDWAGAVIQKPLAIQKFYGPI